MGYNNEQSEDSPRIFVPARPACVYSGLLYARLKQNTVQLLTKCAIIGIKRPWYLTLRYTNIMPDTQLNANAIIELPICINVKSNTDAIIAIF